MDSDDEAFLVHQLGKYRPALAEFRATRSYRKSRIPQFAEYNLLQKHTEIRPYESILFGLHSRPRHIGFEDPDEWKDFCEALVIAWRLVPDAWVGLQMMLEYLVECTPSSDL